MNECDFVESTEYGEYCTLYDKDCNRNECKVIKYGLGEEDIKQEQQALWEIKCDMNR